MKTTSAAVHIMQASPITRIRLPEWHAKLLENPALIHSKEPFNIHIPRPSGDIQLVHLKPTDPRSLISKGDRVVDEDEVSPLVTWLTDPASAETDMYGVVKIEISDKIADTITAMMFEGNDMKHLQELITETKKRMKEDFKAAQKIADERVMRSCGKMYNVVKLTVEDMKKNNRGVYSPSYAEALAIEVMSKTIQKARVPDQQAVSMMNKAMSNLEQPV